MTRPTKKFSFMYFLAHFILKLSGWRIAGTFPDLPKFVVIGAPHTSNWDFILAMLLMFGAGERFNWIAKDSLFRGPWGGFFRSLGGIPVRRDRSTNFVAQITAAFERSERLVIVLAPEGTRRRVSHWRTGFYYMALGAKVPIVMAYVDCKHKEVGIGPMFYPTGDIHADFTQIRDFYATKVGFYPEKQGPIEIRIDFQ